MGGADNLEDLEVGRVLAEAEGVETELARLAAVLKHVDGGDLALVREHLDEADGERNLAQRLGRDLRRRRRRASTSSRTCRSTRPTGDDEMKETISGMRRIKGVEKAKQQRAARGGRRGGGTWKKLS